MSEEIKEEKLDSPLVVHHKDDASYQETASEIELNETHEEDEAPTLTRHRFKREEKKKGNKGVFVLIVIVVLASVFCALYFTDNVPFSQKETTTKSNITTTQATTTLQEAYAQTIVVKSTYIFVDGEQVDGIEGLQKALRYVDPNETPYTIINEDADGDFLNYDVLPILMELGFYGEGSEIEHKNLTGLIAKEEQTEPTTISTTLSTTVKEE